MKTELLFNSAYNLDKCQHHSFDMHCAPLGQKIAAIVPVTTYTHGTQLWNNQNKKTAVQQNPQQFSAVERDMEIWSYEIDACC